MKPTDADYKVFFEVLNKIVNEAVPMEAKKANFEAAAFGNDAESNWEEIITWFE